MEKRGLGRGLSALIPLKPGAGITQGRKEEVVYVPVKDIRPNPYQPRINFDAEDLEELKASIKEKGIIQPILVRAVDNGYELIAGERRLRAAKSLIINEIPVIVRAVKDEESLETALVENIQRQNLNPIEEARAYQNLIEQFDYTQDRIAQMVGKARASVANALRLLKLPQEIQEMLRKELLSFGHGKVLLEAGNDIERQKLLATEVVDKKLSVRELESLLSSYGGHRKIKVSCVRIADNPYKAVEEELQQFLGSKVKIILGRKKGAVQIEFYSSDDLERICKVIKNESGDLSFD